MGIYNRDYTQDNFHHKFRNAPQMRMRLPSLTPVVKWLLIINVAVFGLSFLVPTLAKLFFKWLSVYPISVGTSLQLWRPITYQFLHGGFRHVFWNMFVLFFFGPMLERLWGSRKFLTFYLICGAAGGLLYPLLVLAGWLDIGRLIGASGSILGMLAAGAILFPNMRVYVWGILPLRLSVLAIILAVISILSVLRPDQVDNAGGEAAHLAGMAAGAIYVLSQSWWSKIGLKFRANSWNKKAAHSRNLQLELDRILEKVHVSGLHSLTVKEKKMLRYATEAERNRK
ncbi:MAG: rhomboid family intramembrane serine protease [Planctomycetes bacterium]|nr:rhomboid family intramembrane serine protease [Planctomycetota bacterium]